MLSIDLHKTNHTNKGTSKVPQSLKGCVSSEIKQPTGRQRNSISTEVSPIKPTHVPLSSSFLGLPYRILNMNPKKELLRGLWVSQQTLNLKP